MNAQPLDKGRVAAVVDRYPVKGEFNTDGSQKMKPKYMTIGEITKWPNDTGGSYDKITMFLNPPTLPCITAIFWDSESQNAQPQAPAQQQQYQQPAAPAPAATQGGYQQPR